MRDREDNSVITPKKIAKSKPIKKSSRTSKTIKSNTDKSKDTITNANKTKTTPKNNKKDTYLTLLRQMHKTVDDFLKNLDDV